MIKFIYSEFRGNGTIR